MIFARPRVILRSLSASYSRTVTNMLAGNVAAQSEPAEPRSRGTHVHVVRAGFGEDSGQFVRLDGDAEAARGVGAS